MLTSTAEDERCEWWAAQESNLDLPVKSRLHLPCMLAAQKVGRSPGSRTRFPRLKDGCIAANACHRRNGSGLPQHVGHALENWTRMVESHHLLAGLQSAARLADLLLTREK